MFWSVRVSFGRPRTIEVVVGVFLRLLLGLNDSTKGSAVRLLAFCVVIPPYYVLECRRLHAGVEMSFPSVLPQTFRYEK